jgi:hypothetical protein
MQWHDLIGQVVKEEIREVIKGYNRLQSKIDDLSSGVYYLRISTLGGNMNEKIRQVKFLKN